MISASVNWIDGEGEGGEEDGGADCSSVIEAEPVVDIDVDVDELEVDCSLVKEAG